MGKCYTLLELIAIYTPFWENDDERRKRLIENTPQDQSSLSDPPFGDKGFAFLVHLWRLGRVKEVEMDKCFKLGKLFELLPEYLKTLAADPNITLEEIKAEIGGTAIITRYLLYLANLPEE